MNRPKLWYGRGYLPHFDGGGIVQFITFRTYDSLPRKVLDRWRVELEREMITEPEYRRKIERYLDGSAGRCRLRDERIAGMVEGTLLHFDSRKYKLIAYVVMPNHVHLLLRPLENTPLSAIMHSIKSYTAHRANAMLGRTGSFWSREYFDRFIRDHDHLLKTIDYIHNNPVKAGLCRRPADWRFSSAYGRTGTAGDPPAAGAEPPE